MAHLSDTAAKAVVALTTRFSDIGTTAERVNMAMLDRLMNPGKGVSPAQWIQPIDVNRAITPKYADIDGNPSAEILRRARNELKPAMFHLPGHFLYTNDQWHALTENMRAQRPSSQN